MKIDDLNLADCDLIVLDVEGAELAALKGARRTIEACHPVIMIEDREHGLRFGVKQGDAPAWLEGTFGYRVAASVRKDVVLV